MAENVRIYLRIRPSRSEEQNSNNSSNSRCLIVDPQDPKQAVTLFNGNKSEIFTYDCVGGPETEQQDIFETVAKPVTEYCLQGYNGTIFAYGQTGSGKTFTMQGPMTETNLIDFNQRGLIPRTFEYLFECIRAEEEAAAVEGTGREFLCKCSYVEIYNENIFDLLDISGNSGSSGCSLREDIKRGVYIEGAREEIINSPSEAYEVYERGSMNRHVAETSMNRESSRSHSVFTLFIQSKQRVGEIMDVRESRFNLVDLAGSERQQMTGTTGQRLKEAGNINKSLLALSNVINGLVDISHGKPRHVQYRDSKLTFLLRDSLGGNAKTVIIANVSPSSLYYNETLSTLKFAQRAKMIKNKAVVNKDIQGNVLQLQAEIQRLQHELYLARHTEDFHKKPRLIPSNTATTNTQDNELDPAEAYLMLTMALERQAESSDEIESFKSKVHLLEELVKRKESQNQSIRMILKFRENSLKSVHNPNENETISDLKEEINELRKIIEHHPEVTRFAYENLQLREKLYKYEAYEKKLEEFENILSRHKQYEQLLTNRLLVLEKSKEQEQETEACDLRDEISNNIVDDNVEMQSINVNKFKELEGELENNQNLIKSLENDLKIERENVTMLRMEFAGLQEIIKEKDNQIVTEFDRFNHELEMRNAEIKKLESEIMRLNALISEKTEISEVLEMERQSVSQLMGEREDLKSKLDQIQRQLEREKEQCKLLLQDYEQAKSEFNGKLSELQGKIEGNREEVEGSLQKVKTAQAEKTLLQQELEVTRQILAEYKSKDQNTTTAQIQAAEQAGKKIVQLETEIAGLKDQITQLSSSAAAATALADRNKILQSENGQLHGKIGKLEFLMRSAQSDNDELMSQVTQLQKHLETSLTSSGSNDTLISSLQSQLDAANHTISSMKRQLSQLESDLTALRSENEKLSQHQNLKQKLQYHLKIKQENNELQEELTKCRDELFILRSKQETFVNVLNEIKASATSAKGMDKIVNMIKTLSL